MKNSLILSDDYVFGPTIQGEGPFSGYPAVFLRLALCNLTCIGYKSEGAPFGCDTFAQWNKSHEMTFEELNTYFEMNNYVGALRRGCRLIITGGEPMIQQEALAEWLIQFIEKNKLYNLDIDFETNGTISPEKFIDIIDKKYPKNIDAMYPVDISINFICCPKLSTNGDPKEKRYKPAVLKWLNEYTSFGITNFKFVVNNEDDIDEIFTYYIDAKLIDKNKCWLMPTAGSREELIERSEKVTDWCIKYGFKFSSRHQIMIWNKKLRV